MKIDRKPKGSGIGSGERSLALNALRESEEKMRSIFRAAPIGIGVVVDRVFKDVNQRFCDLTGYTREELINKSARMVYSSEEDYQFVGREKYRQIADRGTGAVETRFRRKDGRVIDVWLSSTPLDTSDLSRGVTFTALDITERKEAEDRLKRKIEELASLSRASQTVTASLDLDKVLSEIVSLAGKVADSDYASVVLVGEDGHIIGRSAESLPGVPALEYRARSGGFTRWIIRSRRPALVDDIGEDGAFRSDLKEGTPRTVNPVLLASGIKSFVGLPLISKDRLFGVLYLHSLRPRVFRDQLPLLTAFANQAAVAVENANLYDLAQKELAERKRAEEALSRTISLLEATLNSTADGILVVDLEGKIQRFNENFRKMWRIPPAILETGEDDRALGFVLDQLKDPEKFLSKVRQLYGEVLAESYDVLDFKDGRVFERFSRPQLLGDTPVGRVWSFRDVTERVKDEEKLRAALGEREVMLREIHHRVKNNIQIISSLLRLQSRYIKDEKALELLDESQNRIRSMALIHEKLYQSQDLSRIDFSDYIAKMITHLFAIYKIESSRIRHNVEAKNIQLDINRAIPCGLIINELITNALKHAFPKDREGEVIISMRSLAGNQYELTVKDNGVGLSEGFNPAKKGTLGFQIVNDLVKQLDGSIEIRRDAGTEIIIRF
jgi:PAS domain S-box-containing protein